MKKRSFWLLATLFASVPAFAQEGAAHAGAGDWGVAIGAALAAAVAAHGVALGQGKTVASAMDGISRNPAAGGKMLVPMLIGLAFMEACFILSWLIAKGLADKV